MFLYLDKNILQYDCDDVLKIKEPNDVCYVYSDEHFNEINRHEDERIFEVLRRIKARKLKIYLDKEFNITDQAIILEYDDPKKLYDNYLSLTAEAKEYQSMFLRLQPFFMGNHDAINPSEINELFVKQIQSLLEDITNISEKSLVNDYENYIKNVGTNLESTLAEAKKTNISIDVMRKKLKANHLSELDPNNGTIVDQIWEIIKKEMPGITKDQFFGKEPLPFLNKKNIPIFLGITQCYAALNFLGCWPDMGLTKISRTYNINSDAAHVAHSIFCSGIISADDRLCKKANAIFQYFQLNKIVIQLKFEKPAS